METLRPQAAGQKKKLRKNVPVTQSTHTQVQLLEGRTFIALLVHARNVLHRVLPRVMFVLVR